MTTVRDVMSTEPAFLLEEDTLRVAARAFRDADRDALPVIGAEGELLGRLTTHAIVVTCIANGGDPAHALVCEYAAEPGAAVEVDEPVGAALRTMAEQRARQLPVIDTRGRFVGVVAHCDALAALSAADGSVTGPAPSVDADGA